MRQTQGCAGFALQAAATLPLAFISNDHGWFLPLLMLTFVGGIANLVASVGYDVAATSSAPSEQQGLATGLVTMSEQIGIILGTPVMSAVVTGWATSTLLPGLQAAVAVNAAVAAAGALLVAIFLRMDRPAFATRRDERSGGAR